MTVAGIDGAGRLGQESEELKINLKGEPLSKFDNIQIALPYSAKSCISRSHDEQWSPVCSVDSQYSIVE